MTEQEELIKFCDDGGIPFLVIPAYDAALPFVLGAYFKDCKSAKCSNSILESIIEKANDLEKWQIEHEDMVRYTHLI